MKRLIQLLLICATTFILVSCGNDEVKKIKIKNGTNITPTLYTLKEQEEHLKNYDILYNAANFKSSTEKEDGTYILPGLIETRTLVLNKENKVSTSYSMDPQGITLTEDYLLLSAYSHDKQHNSVIYVMDRKTHQFIKTVVLEGNPHVGGIAYDSKHQNIWVCSITKDKKAAVAAFTLEELEAYDFNKQKQPIKYSQNVALDNIKRASYIAYYDDKLYIGYFSKEHEGGLDEYDIDAEGTLIKELKHRTLLTTKDDLLRPEYFTKVGHGIQGITFYKNWMLLSQSYGMRDSEILVFDINQKERKYLDKDTVLRIKAPPYLEQITVEGDKLYTIFESATERFRKLPEITKVDRVIQFDINQLTKVLNNPLTKVKR